MSPLSVQILHQIELDLVPRDIFADWSGPSAPSVIVGWVNANQDLLQSHTNPLLESLEFQQGGHYRTHHTFPDPGFVAGSQSWRRFMYLCQWGYISEDVVSYLTRHSDEISACGEKRNKIWQSVLTLPFRDSGHFADETWKEKKKEKSQKNLMTLAIF